MGADCSVCYVSDIDFLLPTLISASGLRRFVPPHKADIFIFTVGVGEARSQEADRFVASQGIRVIAMDDYVFSGIDREKLAQTYTPMATFGRFFMDDLLPASCKRIIYLDGDTWVDRDPSALIDGIVPEGRFAAVEDTIFLRQKLGFGKTTQGIRRYFRQLGLTPDTGYFNAGVFAASRATWKTIAREAFAFFLNNREACKHFDQSAINAVLDDRRLRLSFGWNFQTQLRFWGAQRYVAPSIYHFNRFPKPWMTSCDPWKEMYTKYEPSIIHFADLKLPLKKLDPEEAAKIQASTRKTYAYLQLPFVSRLALMSMAFKDIEKNSWLHRPA